MALLGRSRGLLFFTLQWQPRPFSAKNVSNTIIIPDDLREQMKEWSVLPYQFAGLPKPIPAPVVPDFAPLTVSQGDPWNYDHCELQPGEQAVFPFTRARQGAFTLTVQCIVSKGSPKHLEWTNGFQMADPLNATVGNDSWTFHTRKSLSWPLRQHR
jgi:hypothetical protein